MLRYLPLVLANMLRNRRRSALTAASIAVALCLLTVLAASYRALFREADANPAQALRLMTHHKISITQPMPVSYLEKIRQVPGVRDAMVWQWFGGTYKDARDMRNFFARFAIEPARLFGIRPEIELPPAEKAAFERQRTACIVGREVAARFDWKPGDRIALVGDIYPVTLELTIAGIFHDPDDDQTLYFNYDYLRELQKSAGLKTDQVGVFQVQAASAADVTSIADAIDKEFENSPAPTETKTERAWQLGFIAFLGDLRLFLTSIGGALAFTMVLISANTITMAVRERLREIGIMKTLGFTPGTIVALVMAEAIGIATVAGACGLGLASLLCIAVRHSGTAYAGLNLRVTAGVAGAALLAAAALGVVSSLVPGWRASHTDIVEALRNTG